MTVNGCGFKERGDMVKRLTRKNFRLALIAFILVGAWYQADHWPIRFQFPLKGQASWYSRHAPGVRERTANNEKFNDTALTCALWGVAFNQKVRVTNVETGESIVVRVNDRGPDRRYVRQGRVIDLTKVAFRRISPTGKGLVDVQVELLEE